LKFKRTKTLTYKLYETANWNILNINTLTYMDWIQIDESQILTYQIEIQQLREENEQNNHPCNMMRKLKGGVLKPRRRRNDNSSAR